MPVTRSTPRFLRRRSRRLCTTGRKFSEHLIKRLKAGYLGTLTVGFLRDGKWIEPTLRYTARDLAGMAANNDDPGRVRPGLNVSQATFYNYLTHSPAWDALPANEKDAF